MIQGRSREVFKSDRLHVIEYAPQVRMCRFDMRSSLNRKFSMQLAMPYVQFSRYLGISGTSLHFSFTNKPISGIRDTVYFPPLPNIWYPSMQVCIMIAQAATMTHLIETFWNTEYLDCEDWYSGPILAKETPMKTYKQWAEKTKEDPRFILDIEWTQPACIAEIPKFDQNGSRCKGFDGNLDYGTNSTNRRNGPIRNFAVYRGLCYSPETNKLPY